MEQREANVEVKALSLISEFAKKFRSIDFTLHPSDIPGESAGKGSNVAWAARKLSEKYSMTVRKDVIITGIDGECNSGRISSRISACSSALPIDLQRKLLSPKPTSCPAAARVVVG